MDTLRKKNAGGSSRDILATNMQSKKRLRDIGIIMTILGILLGIGVSSTNNDLAGILLLIGIIGIVMGIVNGIGYRKAKELNP